MNPPYNTSHVHREACDKCHSRKVHCISDGKACQNCISTRERCVFSPRNPPGRPQKRPKSTSDGLPVRLPCSTSNSSRGLPSIDPNASWQRPSLTPSSSLDSTYSFFGGNSAEKNQAVTPSTSMADLEDHASQYDSNNARAFNMDFANTYTTAEGMPMFQHHRRSDSQGHSGGTSQNDSEGDIRSLGEDRAIKQSHIQHEDQVRSHSLPLSGFGLDPSPPPTYDFMYTFSQLSKFLFDLRRDQNNLLQEQRQRPMAAQTSLLPLQEIFHKVSAFIEVSKIAINHLDLMMVQGATSEIQSLTHLSLMVISITVDIYLSLAHAGIFSDNPASITGITELENTENAANRVNMNTWASINETQRPVCTNSSMPPSNFPPLAVVLNLTTMDFHMAQFQGLILQMFTHLLAIDQGASEELHKTQGQTTQVRSRLQFLITNIMSGEKTMTDF